MTDRLARWQGMNWCRPSTRLAIYLRDGLACVYCAAAAETGTTLCLDHVIPASKGGGNAPRNLVTACKRCNDSRGNRSLSVFAAAIAAYLNRGAQPGAIVKDVRACQRRSLPRAEACDLLARRGSVSRVLLTSREA